MGTGNSAEGISKHEYHDLVSHSITGKIVINRSVWHTNGKKAHDGGKQSFS